MRAGFRLTQFSITEEAQHEERGWGFAKPQPLSASLRLGSTGRVALVIGSDVWSFVTIPTFKSSPTFCVTARSEDVMNADLIQRISYWAEISAILGAYERPLSRRVVRCFSKRRNSHHRRDCPHNRHHNQ